jgi:hypothetical protein
MKERKAKRDGEERRAPIRYDRLSRLKETVGNACDRFFLKRGLTKAKWNW